MAQTARVSNDGRQPSAQRRSERVRPAMRYQHAILVGQWPRDLIVGVAAVADVMQEHDRRRGLVAPLQIVEHDARRQQHRSLDATMAVTVVVAKEFAIVHHHTNILTKLQVGLRSELDHACVIQVAVRSREFGRVLVRLLGAVDLGDARVDGVT